MVDQLDSESRVQDHDHVALKLWLRLLTCSNMIESVLRQKLRTHFGSTLPRFDLMAQLDRHPEKLTMGDLSSLMMVSGGNVTGLVKQLESEGLVKRTPMESDRRAYLVGLTASGRRQFRRMAQEHEKWVADLFSDMDTAQQEAAMATLAHLKRSVKRAVEQ